MKALVKVDKIDGKYIKNMAVNILKNANLIESL